MEIQSVAIGAPPAGTGDGGIIKQQLVETPEGQPDQNITYIPVVIAILARVGSTFFTTLSGQVTAGAFNILHGQTWQEALTISASAAVVVLIISLGTIFGNLEKRYPIVSQLT